MEYQRGSSGSDLASHYFAVSSNWSGSGEPPLELRATQATPMGRTREW